MRLAEMRIHDLVLSEDLLDELAKKWQEGRDRRAVVPSRGAAEAALRGIRETFPDEILSRHQYQHLSGAAPGDDPDDKPHIAAAAQGGATHIVTNDQQGGFPPDEIHRQYGIAVVGPGNYFAELSSRYPEDVRRVIESMARKRAQRHPETTTGSVLDHLSSLGLDEMVTNIQQGP